MSSINKDAIIEIQSRCINDIQDYFEYRYESKKDKEYVYNSLNTLHNRFKTLKENTK